MPVEVIKRIGKGHDTDDINYSASAIRKTLDENEISSLYNCEKAVLYKLRNMSRDDFARIADVTEGLENRIYEAAREAQSLDIRSPRSRMTTGIWARKTESTERTERTGKTEQTVRLSLRRFRHQATCHGRTTGEDLTPQQSISKERRDRKSVV